MTTESTAQFEQLAPKLITPCPWQTRRFGGDDGVDELARSVKQVGVIEPLIVRPRPSGAGYELLAGERRLRAAEKSGLEVVPAIVREDLVDDDEAAATVCLTENLQRRDLHALEEAEAIAKLRELPQFGSVEDVAAELGFTASRVARRARLTTLSERWLAAIAGDVRGALKGRPKGGRKIAKDDLVKLGFGRIPTGGLEAIAALSPEAQDQLLNRFFGRYYRYLPDTVAEWRKEVAREQRTIASAPWSATDEDLVPDAGPCSTCPHTSAANPLLFDEDRGDGDLGNCLSLPCWDRKQQASADRAIAELTEEHGEDGFSRLTERYGGDSNGAIHPGWQRKVSATPKRGYKPAVWIDGPDRGRKVFLAPVRSASSTGSQPKKTVAEKRAALQNRRKGRAIELVHEQVESSKKIPRLYTLIGLAIIVGTDDSTTWIDGSIEDDLNEWADSGSQAKAREALWREQLWPVIKRRTAWDGYGSPDRGLNELRVLVGIGTPLGIDVDAAILSATQAMPEPKAWEKQEAAEKATKKKGKAA